jgi:hypothetical protein
VANALVDLALNLPEVVPALLVAYLLMRSRGGLAAIGLDRSQPRADLAPTGKLFVLAYLLPVVAIYPLLSLLGIDGSGTDPNRRPTSAVFLIPLVTSALVARRTTCPPGVSSCWCSAPRRCCWCCS